MEKLTPTPEQETVIQQMVACAKGDPDKRGVILGAHTGAGKTVLCVETAIRLGAQVILVIAPLGTRVGWERTFRRQGWTGPVRRLETKVHEEVMGALIAREPGVYLVGREYFRLAKNNWRKVLPDVVIYDEVHAVSGRKTQGFKQVKTLRAKMLKVASSGTWFGNRFEGAWAISRWLWPNLVDPSFWRWVARWAQTDTIYMRQGGELKEITKVSREKNPGAYAKAVPCYAYLAGDSNLKEVTTARYVDLTPAQRKMYNQMEDQALAWLEEHPLVADLPIAQRTRLRQMTLGTVTINAEGDVDFDVDKCKSSKLDAAQEILADLPEGEPVVLYTSSARFAKVVKARLGEKAALWIGETKHSDRERLLETFGREGGPQYLVATIPSFSEGLDGAQHVCHNAIWLDVSENNIINQQARARLCRKGQTKTVVNWEIRATDSLDDDVSNSLLRQTLDNRASMAVTS